MLYKIYHPFVYGIHVTRSWLRLTLSLDRISSNFQYSMTARSKELIIKIHGDNSKVFHREVELSTRNVTVGKLALASTPFLCCLSFRLFQNITVTWSHQTARWLQNVQTWLLHREKKFLARNMFQRQQFLDTDNWLSARPWSKIPQPTSRIFDYAPWFCSFLKDPLEEQFKWKQKEALLKEKYSDNREVYPLSTSTWRCPMPWEMSTTEHSSHLVAKFHF